VYSLSSNAVNKYLGYLNLMYAVEKEEEEV
jgi:hypothetical protein